MFDGENLLVKQITFFEPYQWKAGGSRLCVFSLQEGRGQYEGGQTSQDLTPGDVCIIPESTGGKLSPLGKSGLTGLRFLLYCEQLSPLLGAAEVCLLEKVSARLTGLKHLPAASAAARRCQTLLSVQPSRPAMGSRTQLLSIALSALADEFEAVQSPQTHAAEGNGEFANLVNRLSLDDLQKLSVDDLATRLGYSRRHLNRLFREHLGTSVSAAKMEVRLLKSLFLLQNPSAKVIDVAMESGFNHLGLFSQCFKRRFGVSPNQWRQKDQLLQGKRTLGELVRDCTLAASGMCLWTNLDQLAKGLKPSSNCPKQPFQNGSGSSPFSPKSFRRNAPPGP